MYGEYNHLPGVVIRRAGGKITGTQLLWSTTVIFLHVTQLENFDMQIIENSKEPKKKFQCIW
jgi:hypothetical protein